MADAVLEHENLGAPLWHLDLSPTCLKTCLCPFLLALRSPLTLSSPFTTSFSLGSHSALNGDLSVPGSYVSLHLSPQVSGSVVYGRSPMVSPQGERCLVSAGPRGWGLGGETRYTWKDQGMGKVRGVLA